MEQKNRIDGKNSSLNDTRLERLQTIGFRWAKRKGQASWDEKFVSTQASGSLYFDKYMVQQSHMYTYISVYSCILYRMNS